MRRRLIWRVLAARRMWGDAHDRAAGSLIGIPAALVFLLALAPAGPLQLARMPLGSASFGVARAEAAPPRLPSILQVSRSTASVSAMSVSPADAALSNSVSSSQTVSSDGKPATPEATSFSGVPQQPTLAPAATPTPTPTATPSPTAPPDPTATASPTSTATPTETPNPYAADKLTDISRVPGWQTINWPAYVPRAVTTAVAGVKGTGQFIMPTTGFISTQYLPTHLGIDIAGPTGAAVLAADTGTVVFAGLDYGGFGYAVEIDHSNGFISAYGHNSTLKVQLGQIVRRGDLIALRGSTGHSTGPHVHFAIHRDGQAVDPFNYLIAGDPPAPAPQVLVPNLVGGTQASALRDLKGLTLQLSVDPPQPSADVPAGKLIVQQPAAGSMADINSALHVTLSSGPPTPTATASASAGASPSGTPAAVDGATATATALATTLQSKAPAIGDKPTSGAAVPTATTALTAVPTAGISTATSTATPSLKVPTATTVPHRTGSPTAPAH